MIPITVTAKNEERAIGRSLDALLESCARSREACDVLVVLDDCTDGTARVVEQRGVRHVTSSGGKVEAQRRGVRPSPFNIFADADIVCSPGVIAELIEVMRTREEVQVAFPHKQPMPPLRASALARGLHRYNQRRPATRTWFSGKLFAIRHWDIPHGVKVDDMYLSAGLSPEQLYETASSIWFRAPETFAGMYAYYHRMRSEAERLGIRFGGRPPGLAASPWVVETALLACRLRFRVDRALGVQRGWQAIPETKCL